MMFVKSSGKNQIRRAFLPCILFLFVLLCVLVSADRGFASDSNGKEAFRMGKLHLESGRLEDAVVHLALAQREFPLLADYALLYLAEAFRSMGDHEKALITVRSLMENYPSSPLIRKARQIEIGEMSETASEREALAPVFGKYVKDYPDDEDTALLYARYLRESGEPDRAVSVLRQIYRNGGACSKKALAELDPSGIPASDLMERSANLMKRYDFEEAEQDLRRALSMDKGADRQEVLKNLAYALFRQKKYREAAALYEKINDTYFMARSLYRSGNYEGFSAALSELIAQDDKRAGYLLLTVAADKRRERDFDKAAATYADIIRKYPSEVEEALWGTGWTHFLAGEYGKASGVFSRLFNLYDEPKYLYWQARSMEAEGKDASALYHSLEKYENNYYGILSSLKGSKTLQPASHTVTEAPSSSRPAVFDRIEALQSFAMQREAVTEILLASKKISSQAEMLSFIAKLHELGEYRREIGLASRLPYSEKMHRFWYPFGFQEIIEPVSRKFSFDPYITLSVIREESRFDPEAISPAGARGLMQIMPQTAYRLDRQLKLGIQRPVQIHDVRKNITMGTYYLKSLITEFDSLAHAIAAYNAGETVVRKWQKNGNYRSVDEFIEDIPYGETRNYVKKVLTSYYQYRKSFPDSSGYAGMNLFPEKN